jgi:hypothetical protein
MTTKQDMAARMAAAATSRAGGTKPTGRTAIRTKPTRITLDLSKADYEALNRWIGSAAVEVNPDHPRLSQAQALRAMIRATTLDKSIGLVVIDLLRQEGE